MNTHWCPWCGDSALLLVAGDVDELRCARCNEPRGQAVTRSTLRPTRTALEEHGFQSMKYGPSARARTGHRTSSIAREYYSDVLAEAEVLLDLAKTGLHDLWRREWDGLDYVQFLDLAPILSPWDEDDYVVLLEREVDDANTPDELVRQVEQLFVHLHHALVAEDEFQPTDVYDAGTNIFGCCSDCHAWPSEEHMLSECETCPTDRGGRPLVYWGTWAKFIDPARSRDRVQVLVRAANRAFHAMARAVEHHSPQRRLAAALKAWRRALEQLPPALPRVQAALFDGFEGIEQAGAP